MAPTTREKAACVIFGASSELPIHVLPTYADVMKAYINTTADNKE